jgi:phosphatidylethanolamine-binding protein (PEBP) family uncharacterized protein
MKHKVGKSSMLVTLFLAGACMLALALAPSIASAKEFTYDKKPAFSVTYPNDWSDNPDNASQYHLLFSAKDAVGIPVINVQVRDIPAGATIADAGKLFKKLILDPEQNQDCQIVSDKQTTLKDGTKANETILKYKYDGWLPLQAVVIAVFKDNKWIRVDIHMGASDKPLWDILHTLTFKK